MVALEERSEVQEPWTSGQKGHDNPSHKWASNQGVGGSSPARVDVSLSKTPNPELLPGAASTVY